MIRIGTRIVILVTLAATTGLAGPQVATTPGAAITGELRQWHKVTLTLDGPDAGEASDGPNPFLDYRMTVTFVHESGAPAYVVPGYFAADGRAADTSATAGNQWRAHLSPDKAGRWDWRVSFVSGPQVAIDPIAAAAGQAVAPLDDLHGSFQVQTSDKTGRDFRARGRLQYAGQRYLRFAASGEHFLKVGADAPETLLGYADFDGTVATKANVPLKTFGPHVADWRAGDPVWQGGKGHGLIGAINYLAAKGVNGISFLTYNAGGDGDNVWPFVSRDDTMHYDASKLDQWQIVLEHAQAQGLHLHFKLQETENDDEVVGNPVPGTPPVPASAGLVPTALDGGDLGPERRLYLRELIARFGYLLALNWNLGEENTQTPEQQRAMIDYIGRLDPYGHPIVVHTYPNRQENVYPRLLGDQSALTGASLQNEWDHAHERVVRWVEASDRAGRPWVVANDEQGPASLGVPPDPGYRGFAGRDNQGREVPYDLHGIRKYTLWGTLMAGGAGVEYYFGYQLPENDLVAEDFRSRDRSWDYGRIALDFFRTSRIPFWQMRSADALVGNAAHDNSRYCLAQPGEIYLVYLPAGGTTELDLSAAAGAFSLEWFDPRNGGALRRGAVTSLAGGGRRSLGSPPDSPGDDWLAVVRRN